MCERSLIQVQDKEHTEIMLTLPDLLSSLSFPELRDVRDRASIANLFPAAKRCGIYILQFSDDEVYAGQALDVTRRYVQHSKVHSDIVNISFKQVAKAELNDEERSAIWELEQNGFHLRNILFTSIPKGDSDFDLIMPIDEQQKWLDDIRQQSFEGAKVQDDTLRRKYHKRFLRLLKQQYVDIAIEVLQKYVRCGLPIPIKSEISFWGCSCLPTHSNPKVTVYSRININWQEVFTVHEYEGVLGFSLHLASSPLEAAFGESLEGLFTKFPDLEWTEHFYEPGGQDQINLVLEDPQQALALMDDIDIVKAIRLFNLRLMKKGPCTYSRYHCMDLSDRLISSEYNLTRI
jgi:hypothetical protein